MDLINVPFYLNWATLKSMIWWAIVYFLHLAKMNGAKKTESKIEVGVCLATKKNPCASNVIAGVYNCQVVTNDCKELQANVNDCTF